MRAPADSTKPTTGAPRAAGEPQHAHDRVGVLLAERAAGERRVLRVAEHRPAVDAPGGADDAVAGAGLLAHPARAHLGADERAASRGSQSASRRSSGRRACPAPPSAARGADQRSCDLQARARRCARRSRTSWRGRRRLAVADQRARLVGDVVEVEPLVGLLVAERRRRDAVAQRQDRRDGLDRAGGAEQVADRRLRSRTTGIARSPSAVLIAIVSARSLSGVDVPCALT